MIKGRCEALVIGRGEWQAQQCLRKAINNGFCKQHHPDSVKARRAKRLARFRIERVESEKRRKIKRKEEEALGVVRRIAAGVAYPTEVATQYIQELDELMEDVK